MSQPPSRSGGSAALLRLPGFRRQWAVGLSNLATYVTLLSLPILLSGREGRIRADTGLVLAASPPPWPFSHPSAAGSRTAPATTAVVGLLLLAIGVLRLAPTSRRLLLTGLLARLALAGAGLRLSTVIQTSAVEAVCWMNWTCWQFRFPLHPYTLRVMMASITPDQLVAAEAPVDARARGGSAAH